MNDVDATGAELGKEWIIRSPQELQGKHLAAVESSYKMSGAVNDVRHTHAALSANVTSLVIRMEEYGARQATIPLEVRASTAASALHARMQSLVALTAVLPSATATVPLTKSMNSNSKISCRWSPQL